MTVPAVGTAVNAPFYAPDDSLLTTLIGYNLPPATCSPSVNSGQALPLATCHLTLIWYADANFPTSMHVFVHLLDESGQIIAQSDGEPANWTRPTTGWLPGENITDTHTLTLPAELPSGNLTLRIGLYDPQTGQRLQTQSADYVEIPLP